MLETVAAPRKDAADSQAEVIQPHGTVSGVRRPAGSQSKPPPPTLPVRGDNQWSCFSQNTG